MYERDADGGEVFDAREIARAGGFDVRDVESLIANGRIRTIDGVFASHAEAARVLRTLRSGTPLPVVLTKTPLFSPLRRTTHETRVPMAVSTGLHVVMLGALMTVSLFSDSAATGASTIESVPPARLVFLATPGPGGGGGGGGLRERRPAAMARERGNRDLPSPVRVPPAAPRTQVDPDPEPDSAVDAPVAVSPADEETRPGVIEETPAPAAQGSGEAGGSGTGASDGMGSGQGAGIGEGSGGGTGGGPFRPGSGIEPPAIVTEVKPDYSEEARRRSVEGDVVLEIVVRRDGSVGDIRLLQGLGYGLDQQAIAAVRQWRFTPARRLGTPVDVMVEVAVEFKLR